MNPFWPRPAKNRPKKKSGSHSSAIAPRKKPDQWTPPHPEALKQKTPPIFPTIVREAPVKEPQKKAADPSPSVQTEFQRTFRELSGSHRAIDVWADFITMFACTISNVVDKDHYDERESRYLSIIKKYNKHEQITFSKLTAFTVEALEENPEQDFLGHMYISLGLADKNKGQVFTPYHVADLMARMSMGEDIPARVREKGFIEVNDPCCGGGVTLIAAINETRRQLEKANLNFQNHILVSGQDIDEVVLMMSYIQISLLGVAGYFKVGNSLTDPMRSEDDKKNYWFTPIYCFSPIWQCRRLFSQINKLTEEETPSES